MDLSLGFVLLPARRGTAYRLLDLFLAAGDLVCVKGFAV